MTNPQNPSNNKKRYVGPGSIPAGWTPPAMPHPEEQGLDLPPSEEELQRAAELQEQMFSNLQKSPSMPKAPQMQAPANNSTQIPLVHDQLKMPRTQGARMNPLAGFFRKPGISIRLPSGVNFYPADQLQLTVTGELEIFPMTLADELILKTPDALLNGAALEQVVVSCAPGVKNPRRLLSPDLDAILLAIRAATYGTKMDVEAKCPKCGAENAYAVDIQHSLDHMTPLEHILQVHLDNGLTVVVQPFDFEASIKGAAAGFEQAKMIQILSQEGTSDEQKMLATLEITRKLTQLQTLLVSAGIQQIILPDGNVVNDSSMIKEWVENASRADIDLLEEEIKKLNSAGVIKEHELTCSSCGHQWISQLNYDPTSFFGKSSSK